MFPIRTEVAKACFGVFSSVLMVLACAGCTYFLSEEPAGDSAMQAKAFWEGTWTPEAVGKDNGFIRPITLTVRDAERGILDAAWIEPADGQLTIRREKVFIRRAGPWLIASTPVSAFFVPESPPPSKTLYAWARVELLTDDLVVVSAPDPNTFAGYLDEAARSKIEKDLVVVARVGMDLLGRLQPEDKAWMRPVVFRKLPQPEKYPFVEDK